MATLLTVGSSAMQLLHWAILGLVAVIAVIGLLFITRGTAVRRVRGIGPDALSLGPNEDNFPIAVALLTGAPIVAGNSVELALDGGVFPRLWNDLQSAQVSITVQMYYAGKGDVTKTLGEILTERARSGVRVYLLYDAFGAKALGGEYAQRLRSAGARVLPFRPLRFANLWVKPKPPVQPMRESMTSGSVKDGPRPAGATPASVSRDPLCCSSSALSLRVGAKRRGSCTQAAPRQRNASME